MPYMSWGLGLCPASFDNLDESHRQLVTPDTHTHTRAHTQTRTHTHIYSRHNLDTHTVILRHVATDEY